jgi:hypothetical protein
MKLMFDIKGFWVTDVNGFKNRRIFGIGLASKDDMRVLDFTFGPVALFIPFRVKS